MKKFRYLILLMCLFININAVKAFSINASSSVQVNTTVRVTVDARGLIGKFTISSSNSSVLSGGDEVWIENTTNVFTFDAKKEGTATITVRAVDVSDTDGNAYTGSRSITIKVVKKTTPQVDINKTYSKNNYLKNLSIDGYKLTPDFNKDTLEYKVELAPGTEKINISAEKEDKEASVKGIGEINVNEGVNTISIIVTAENGNERVYKIIANVEEKDPIKISINNTDYTVVKKKELLTKPDGYEETSVNISGFEIPAFYNDVTKVTLIGLKNSNGDIKLYSYDTKNGTYKEYKEYSFDKMNLYIHEDKNTNYKKIKIKINGDEVVAYKVDGLKDYYLLYATNTITGNESYYLYDILENSVQRYNTDLVDTVMQQKDKYFSVVLVLSCVCFLSMLFLLIEINKKEA